MSETVFDVFRRVVADYQGDKSTPPPSSSASVPSSSSSSSSAPTYTSSKKYLELEDGSTEDMNEMDVVEEIPRGVMHIVKFNVLRRKKQLIPTDKDFFNIASTCKNYGEVSNKLSYDEYVRVREEEIVPVAKRYFSASNYLMLPKDEKGGRLFPPLLQAISNMVLQWCLYTRAS